MTGTVDDDVIFNVVERLQFHIYIFFQKKILPRLWKRMSGYTCPSLSNRIIKLKRSASQINLSSAGKVS